MGHRAGVLRGGKVNFLDNGDNSSGDIRQDVADALKAGP